MISKRRKIYEAIADMGDSFQIKAREIEPISDSLVDLLSPWIDEMKRSHGTTRARQLIVMAMSLFVVAQSEKLEDGE